MTKLNTTSVKLNSNNQLVQLSTSPENVSVGCESTTRCHVYVFTSDAANPSIPYSGDASHLDVGERQTYGDPFNVWVCAIPFTAGDLTFSANVVYEKWDS